MKKFVIGGTGRSGSKYISELITKCGVSCGHESVVNNWSHPDFGFRKDWVDKVMWGDSSLLTTPFYDEFMTHGFLCFHQMRSYRDCVSALKRGGHFKKGWLLDKFIKTHCPELEGSKNIYQDYYVMWNEMGLMKCHASWYVDKIDVGTLKNICYHFEINVTDEIIKKALQTTSKNINSTKCL